VTDQTAKEVALYTNLPISFIREYGEGNNLREVVRFLLQQYKEELERQQSIKYQFI